MKPSKRFAAVLGAFGIASISLASLPAKADKYIYYPAQQVYFNPARTTYYYQNNGTWTSNTSVPATIQLGKSVSVDLQGDTPYVYHQTVIKQYPATTVVTPPTTVKVED